jgi:hypothetical protein
MEEVSPQWTAQTVGRHPMRCLRNSLKDWMRGKRFNIHFLATSIDFKAHQAGLVFFRRDYYRLQHDVSPVVLTAFARPVKHFR